MSIELKPREWLLAMWANGTFTIEAEDAPCWQSPAPPAQFRAVAALPVEAEIKRLHEGREEAEAAWNAQYDELTRLRAALAAAEARAVDMEERWREEQLRRATAELALADERRHADALALALRTTSEYPHDYSTRDRAIALHAARRAAEAAPKPAPAKRADAGPFGKWEIEPAVTSEHDLTYTNDDGDAFDIGMKVLERLFDDIEPGETRTLRITLNAEEANG